MSEQSRPYDWAKDDLEPFCADEKPDSETVQSDRRLNLATIGVVALIGASLVPGILDTIDEYKKTHETCDAPPAEAIAATKKLFSTPHAAQTMPFAWKGLSFKKESYDKVISEMEDISVGSTARFNSIVAKANTFTGRYGVRISYGDKNEETKDGWQIPNDKVLKTENAALAVDNIVSGLSDLPVEYVHATGLTRIVLRYKYFKKDDPLSAAGFVPGNGKHTKDSMYLNLNYEGNPETVAHEAYHVLDNRECGIIGSGNDKAFKTLNRADIYGADKQPGLHALFEDNQTEALNKLATQIQYSAYHGKEKEAEVLRQRAFSLIQKTPVVYDHGFANVKEDKAGIAQLIGEPEKLSIPLDTSIPILREKTLFLLARLYTKLPEYVRYLSRTTRPINRLGYFK